MEDNVLRAVGRLEGKVDGLCESMTRLRKDVAGSEKRVRSLESAKNWAVGAVVSSGAAWAMMLKQWLGIGGK